MKAIALLCALAGTALADDIPLEPPQLDQPRSTAPIDPASTTVPPPEPPFARVFDSRDAFDSRRATHPFGLLLDGRFSGVFGEVYGMASATLAAPFAPRFGRLRLSFGFGFVDPDDEVYRFGIGWERWAFCIRRTVCPGAAIDLEYAYADPLDGTLATPHAFVDFKTQRARGLGLRVAGGPAILMATSTDNGRDRFDVGWSVSVAVGLWAAY